MLTSISKTEATLISLGTVLHNAALASQAAIEAIPEDADIYDEANVIEAAIAPVDELAKLILRTSSRSSTGEAIVARARAWMEGEYWATAGARV